jgi:hypothetical protein
MACSLGAVASSAVVCFFGRDTKLDDFTAQEHSPCHRVIGGLSAPSRSRAGRKSFARVVSRASAAASAAGLAKHPRMLEHLDG